MACPRDHVSRVLLVARRVHQNELTRGCRKVAIGHIDGDALLTLRLEAIDEHRQLKISISIDTLLVIAKCSEVIIIELLGVM